MGLPTHACSSCQCVRTDHPASVEHPEIVPTAIAKEAERGHPGGPFVNLLLVPRVCARFWLAHMPKKAHFGRTFLDLSAPSGRSVSVSILTKHGAVHDAKFDQLHDIASRPGHPNC